jgi:major membrane immunogen (membrane-anchored lipoprotein)
MRKIAIILFVLLVAVSFAFAEGKQEQSGGQVEFEDGFYFAQEDGFSEKTGWKYVVTMTVENGEITEVQWDGAHKAAGYPKDYQSRNGMYGMVEHGDAQAPWYEQAEAAEEYLLEKQDPLAINYTDEAGSTDDISGVSIHVKALFELAQKAIKKGPVGRGPYEDGYYHAEADEFHHGWKDYVDLTVLGGRIVAAEWSAYPEEGEKHKKKASMDGEYGMVANSDATVSWAEQAGKAEAYLEKTNDPADISLNDEGYTDAISGVSVTVANFFKLAQEALEQGPES